MIDNIKICGFNYAIRTVSNEELNSGEGPDIAGDCDSMQQVIRLLDTLPAPAMDWVLYHEVLHAFLAHSGLAHLIPEELQEGLCDSFGSQLVSLLRDNPQLTKAPQGETRSSLSLPIRS